MTIEENRNIRTDVPISLHPDVLNPLQKALDVKDTPGQQAFKSARTALGELYAGYASLEDAIAAAKEARKAPPRPYDPRSGSRPAPDLSRAAQIAFDRAGKKIDSAIADLRRSKEHIAKRIEEATADPIATSPVGIAVASEVRAFVRSVKESERVTFVYGAIKDGDRRTYNAVVSAPAFLAGLKPKDVELVRKMASREWANADTEQSAAVEKALDHIQTASLTFVKRYSEVIEGEETADAAARRAIEKLAAGGGSGR